ncbi:hypothetical protein [Kitasatospora sp. NPDC094015]|uniref:hypothetical protein n=1 Tax=Kitasatospora sp. NPDC094015 TaxID=3155205 RepID=UPI003329A0E1
MTTPSASDAQAVGRVEELRRAAQEQAPNYWTVRAASTPGVVAGERLLAEETADGSFVLMPHRADEVCSVLDHVKMRSAYASVGVDLDKLHLLPPAAWPLKDRPEVRHTPDLACALNAREALSDAKVQRGPGITELDTDVLVRGLLTHSLCLPTSARWEQAAGDALLGDWVAPLTTDGRLSPLAVGALKAEVRSIHRQLVPLWRRGTRHGRTLSLDIPIGNGLSLYEVLASRPSATELAAAGEPDDPRLAALLRALTPEEGRVVRAWAQRGIATWADAAWSAGAADPQTAGERVRRKVRYLVVEQDRRRANLPAAAATAGGRL